MGSRTASTVKEIEDIREGLEAKIVELGKRLPPAVQWGRRAIAGVGGGVVLFALNRMRARAKTKPKSGRVPAAPPITVNAGIGLPAALAVAAVWAGVRLYEAKQRAASAPGERAVVRSLPAERGVS